jgi:putative DNA primase/helicase
MLLIPLHKNGVLTGLQFIKPDGEKRFLGGTEKKGSYFSIPGAGATIYIVEGFATGATIHALTGGTVIVAFDCGNFMSVAKSVKASHPDSSMVICADNDRHKPDNPGLTKARAAALATGAKLAIPIFPGDEGTDFNDLVTICGAAGAA